MNLDIEGHELKVLRTINFKKVKIKYLCVEMINHNSFSIENNNEIENLLKMNKHQEGLDYIKETSGVIEFGEKKFKIN